MPPVPVFIRPQIAQPNPQMVAAHFQQQQMLQQQQMENFQRFQLMQQQQAIAQQQAMAAQQRFPSGDEAASLAINGQQQMPPPNGIPNPSLNGRPPLTKRHSSSQNTNSMPPPSQPRQSLSPTNSIHPSQQLPINGQSPLMVNGMILPTNKNGFNQLSQPLESAAQQRIIQARASALAQAQQAAALQLPNGMAEQTNGDQVNGSVAAEHVELARLAQQAGFGANVQAFMEARNKARILSMAKFAAVHQQQQLQQQGQANGSSTNGNATPQPAYGSPALASNAQMQLKFPAHAAARLGASQAAQQRV